MNILGAINLDDMSVVAKEYESNINGASVVDFCNEIKENYADKQVIHYNGPHKIYLSRISLRFF